MISTARLPRTTCAKQRPVTKRGLERRAALEPAREVAGAGDGRSPADPTACASEMLLSAMSTATSGKGERLAARRRQQFVELAPADPALRPDGAA